MISPVGGMEDMMQEELTFRQKMGTLLVFGLAYLLVNPLVSRLALNQFHWSGMGVLGTGLLATLVCLVLYAQWAKLPLINIKNFTLKNFGLALLVGFLGNIGINLLASSLQATQPENQALVEVLIGQSSPILSFVTVVLLAPLVEELIFRQLFVKFLFPRYPWLGLVISSLLFALAHGAASPYEFLLYGGPGLILGALCAYRGVETSMMWHMTSNGLALAMALYSFQ